VQIKRLIRQLKKRTTKLTTNEEIWRVASERARVRPSQKKRAPAGVIAVAAVLALAAVLGLVAATRKPAVEPPARVSVAPPPVLDIPEPEVPDLPEPPEPEPADPAPGVAAAPRPPRPPRAGTRAPSAKALQGRIGRLEQALKARTPPAEAPNRAALDLLNKQRLELTFPNPRLMDVAKALDQWEKIYLR
jgi:type IV secretory pathway VirB10-like protein